VSYCNGEVTYIPIQIQAYTLCTSAFVLPIAFEELVLDDNWLEILETHWTTHGSQISRKEVKF